MCTIQCVVQMKERPKSRCPLFVKRGGEYIPLTYFFPAAVSVFLLSPLSVGQKENREESPFTQTSLMPLFLRDICVRVCKNCNLCPSILLLASLITATTAFSLRSLSSLFPHTQDATEGQKDTGSPSASSVFPLPLIFSCVPKASDRDK